MSTPIAIVTALGAALTLGISSVADHRSTKRVPTRKALSPRIVANLVRQPLWLTALCANVVGFALQVVALASGSIALVQPLLVCDLIFAVLIARYLSVRAHRPHLPTRRVFTGIAATTLGVAGFLAIGQPSAGRTYVSSGFVAPLAVGLILAAMGCLVAATRGRNLQPLTLAVACGVAYGTAAFAIKLVTLEFSGGLAQVFSNWPIYFFAVAGPASSSTRTHSSGPSSSHRSRALSPRPTRSFLSRSASPSWACACTAAPRPSPARWYRSCS